MRSLSFTESARDDIEDIAAYVEASSGSRATAERLVDRILDRCASLAALPGTMGRARHEIGPRVRSASSGNHTIFFRYDDEELVVIGVVEGHRDIPAVLEGRD